MTKVTLKFKCDNCENGIVQVVTTDTKGNISINVGSCNSCKKSFGIKSAGKLQQQIV